MIGDIALELVLHLFSPHDGPARSAHIVRDDGGVWVGSVYLRREDAQRLLQRKAQRTARSSAAATVG